MMPRGAKRRTPIRRQNRRFSMHTLRSSVLPSLCVLLVLPVILWAKNTADTAKPKASSSALAATKSAISITLIPSREQAVAGSYFGITARVENISEKPVYFTPKSFTMTPPPELDPDGPSDWQAFFADIQVPGVDTNSEEYWTLHDNTVIALTPGSNVSAFWSGRFHRPETSAFRQFVRSLSFAPSRYTLTVVGAYWDTPDGPTNKAAAWHTQTAEMNEVISAPQSVILFGAGIGGVFAFLLVWRFNKSLYSGWGRGNVVGMLSAISLSIIVTILIARLSDSQFIIRVTVNDLWGAMAVGFIGAASGPAILQKFVSAMRGEPAPGDKEKQPAEKRLPPAVGPDDAQSAIVHETPGHESDVIKAA